MAHRRSGNASANHGISHRLYCGEYTLFASRNATRMGNPSCHLGVSGCRRTLSTHTRPAAATNASRDTLFTRFVLPHGPRCR